MPLFLLVFTSQGIMSPMMYSALQGTGVMKKPSNSCLKAVQDLTKHHAEDCATYYSLDGVSAVLVITDPEIAHRMVQLMSMLISVIDEEVSGLPEGVVLMHPIDPIEA
jgi:hypothetical protein